MRPTVINQFVVLFLLVMLQRGWVQPAAGQTIAPPLELNKSVGRTLRPDESHTYTLVLRPEQVMNITLTRQGTTATVRVTDAAGNVVPCMNRTTGQYDEEHSLFQAPHAGLYTVQVRAPGNLGPAGHYTLELSELVSGQTYAARLAETRRKQASVVTWLKSCAIPLTTLSVDSSRTDLAPLKDKLRDVRFIGLGEETHGTHEFFSVKHRLLDFLVREMGFRMVVIEGSYAGWQQINDYVAGRTDDGDKALAGQGFWAWDTEEMKALIDWARQYNRTVSAAEQVRFAGIDPQYNQPGKDKLLAYLKRVAPERVAPTEALFTLNLDSLQAIRAETGPEAQKVLKQAQASYGELYTFLEKLDSARLENPEQTMNPGLSEAEQMREQARVLTQYVSMYNQADTVGVATRDVFMAGNCRRLIERELTGTRFVIWGHNGHVATGGNSLFKPLGAYLREFYGNAYYALGFSFNQGTFLARDVPTADSTRQWLKPFTVRPAPEPSVDGYLARIGLKNFIVDFRTAPQNADSNTWLAEPIPMRSVGSVYRPGFASAYFYPTRLAGRFDGLLFVDKTTRAHPNPSVQDVAGGFVK